MDNTINFEGHEVSPSKIVCVGRNYVDHINELGNEVPVEPVIFVKPNSAIANDIYTHEFDEIHYEGEISFLINGGDIVGVGFGLDLTKRCVQSNLKKKGLPWERAKAFDKSAVFSGFVRVPQHLEELRLELHINGTLRQGSGCQFMLNSPKALLNEISSFMTLADGDILMTGTPSGVGQVHVGDKFVGGIYSGNELLVRCSWQVKSIQ